MGSFGGSVIVALFGYYYQVFSNRFFISQLLGGQRKSVSIFDTMLRHVIGRGKCGLSSYRFISFRRGSILRVCVGHFATIPYCYQGTIDHFGSYIQG